MMEFNTKTIREIALEQPLTTRVFEEYKIDYCCGGYKPFAEACQSAGVDPQVLSEKLAKVLNGSDYSADFPEKKAASDLIDYIIEKHHVFTTNELERLTPLMAKVCRKHGEGHRELLNLQVLFAALVEDLTIHMKKEEMVLFPFIKNLQHAVENDLSVALPHFRTVQNPIRMMFQEHDTAGDILRQMRELTADYAVSPEMCPSFRALYAGLEDLEKDLHRHIHLENNVLFPQALALEVEVFGEKDAKQSEIHQCCSSLA